MTAEELLAMRGVARNNWGDWDGCGYRGGYDGYRRGHSGQRATGIALGAVGLGVAVIGLPLVAVLAKAFSGKAEAMAAGVANGVTETNNLVRMVAAGLQQESQNRERSIQIERNERVSSNPSLRNYIDIAAGAGAYSGATSNSQAQAAAAAFAANGAFGLNSAIESSNALRVMPVSAPQPCCNPCNQ